MGSENVVVSSDDCDWISEEGIIVLDLRDREKFDRILGKGEFTPLTIHILSEKSGIKEEYKWSDSKFLSVPRQEDMFYNIQYTSVNDGLPYLWIYL